MYLCKGSHDDYEGFEQASTDDLAQQERLRVAAAGCCVLLVAYLWGAETLARFKFVRPARERQAITIAWALSTQQGRATLQSSDARAGY